MSSRDRFEFSVRDRGFSRAMTPGGEYENRMVQEWWETWRAARAEALEEAVVECERISISSKTDGYVTEAAAEQGCADAIRALKDKEPA